LATTTDDRVQIHLKIPPEAKRRLQQAALNGETNLNDYAGEILCASVGVDYVSRSNRRSPFGGGRPAVESPSPA
jgi:hypothetical protein